MFFGLDDSYPSKKDLVFTTGAVIGCKQFIKNEYWDMDLICQKQDSILAKIDYESYSLFKD